MQVSRYLSLILLGLALNSCSERQFDSKTEGEKLLARDAEWADLATAGKDVEKVVSYWSDDAVLIFPGQPVLEGKAAIRAYVAASFNTPGFKIHWVSQKPIFSPDGKLAYMQGTDDLTLPGPNGGTMTLHLRGISVWRLDPDRQWRCVLDISNEAPTAPSSQHAALCPTVICTRVSLSCFPRKPGSPIPATVSTERESRLSANRSEFYWGDCEGN